MDVNDFVKDGKLRIIVRINSPKTEITGYDTPRGAVRMNVKAPPEKGKANREIVKFLTRITKRQAVIVSGLKSKEKVIKLCD